MGTICQVRKLDVRVWSVQFGTPNMAAKECACCMDHQPLLSRRKPKQEMMSLQKNGLTQEELKGVFKRHAEVQCCSKQELGSISHHFW